MRKQYRSLFGGGILGSGSGGGGLPTPDMLYDPQWIIDNAAAGEADDGNDLFATGKHFQTGGEWESEGVNNHPLQGNVTTLGTVQIHHSGGPNSNPMLQFLRVSGNNPYLYALQADEPDFYNDEFTHFFVCARDPANTTGIRAIAGTQKISANQGWRLAYNGTGANVQFVTYDGLSGATHNIAGYTPGSFDIIAIQYDGTNKKAWMNTYFTTPDVNTAVSFAKRTGTNSGNLNKFQMGNDGDQTLRAFLQLAEVRMYQSALGETDFDAIMDDLASKHAITVS